MSLQRVNVTTEAAEITETGFSRCLRGARWRPSPAGIIAQWPDADQNIMRIGRTLFPFDADGTEREHSCSGFGSGRPEIEVVV